jgi:hypothetical protein
MTQSHLIATGSLEQDEELGKAIQSRRQKATTTDFILEKHKLHGNCTLIRLMPWDVILHWKVLWPKNIPNSRRDDAERRRQFKRQSRMALRLCQIRAPKATSAKHTRNMHAHH